MTNELEKRFDAAMMDVYRRAKAEVGYIATRYFQMLSEHRGIETARILLRANGESEGFTALWERGRLDLSVEALIYDHSEYHSLFTPEEREMARKRLQKYRYPAAMDPVEPFIGAFSSNISDWADEHDKYLGEGQMEPLRNNRGNGK